MIVYLSVGAIGGATQLPWVDELKAATADSDIVFYDPRISFTEQVLTDKRLREQLMAAAPAAASPQWFVDDEFGLIFSSLQQVMPVARVDDVKPTIGSTWRSLYVLARANAILVDITTTGYGDKGQEALYAHLLGIPAVAVTDRFLVCPWLVRCCSAVVRPNVDDIMQQLVRHGVGQESRSNGVEIHHDACSAVDDSSRSEDRRGHPGGEGRRGGTAVRQHSDRRPEGAAEPAADAGASADAAGDGEQRRPGGGAG